MATALITSKSIAESKTVIANVAVAVATIATAMLDQQLLVTHAQWFIAFVAGLNVVLRLFQKQPVTLTGGARIQVDH